MVGTARCEPSVKELGVLVNRPLKHFKKANSKLNEHFSLKKRKSHKIAMERAMAFCAVMENGTIAINQQISSKRAKLVAENRCSSPLL